MGRLPAFHLERTWLLYRALAAVMRLIALPFVRIVISGGGALVKHDGPWVFACNHRSVFDFPLAVIALVHFRRVGRILIASEFFTKPWQAKLLHALDAIPVYRGTDPQAALAAGIAALQHGKSICIMPEGTVQPPSLDRRATGPARSGVSRLAVGAGVPVLPICMVGTDDVWPKDRLPRLWRRQTVLCKVAAEPVWLDGDDHRANTEQVMAVIEAMLAATVPEWEALTRTR